MQLTTGWQTVASWRWTYSAGTKILFYIQARYTEQDIVNNRSYVQTRIMSTMESGSASGTGARFELNYCVPYNSGSQIWYYGTEQCLPADPNQFGGSWVYHNQDGTLAIPLIARVANGWFGFDQTFGDTVTLPVIPRASKFSTNSSVYVGNNLRINITKYAPSFYNEMVYEYRGTNNSSKSITVATNITGNFDWSVPRSIYSNKTDGKYVEGTLKLYTYSNSSKSTLIGDVQSETLRCDFVQSELEPTITSYSFEETDTDVIAKFGNSAKTIFKQLSKPKLTVSASYKYGATIKSISIRNGLQVKYSNPANFDTVTENIFTVTITDSRDYPKIQNISAEHFSDYLIASINSYRFRRGGADSNILFLDMDMNYFNGNIVYTNNNTQTIANTPVIRYKIGEDGTIKTLTSSQYTISNNKITVNNLNIGSNYNANQVYKAYLYFNDYLTSDTENYVISKAVPTCEMGENDFQVNGQLILADEYGENTIVLEIDVVDEW